MLFGPPKRLKKAARIILVGAPGVGKGTQTERLLAKFPQLASISSGDLLRENVRNKTPIGMLLQPAYSEACPPLTLQAAKSNPRYSPAI